MKYLILFSQRSGGRHFVNHEQRIRSFFEDRGLDYDFKVMQDDLGFLQEASNYDRILIAGGDGTVRWILEYVLEHQLDLVFGLYPLGSFNGLAKSFKIYRGNALERFVSGEVQNIDIGMMNDRPFLISICFGKVAELTVRAEKSLKKTFGFFAYAVMTFVVLCGSFRARSFHMNGTVYQAHSLLIFLRHATKYFLPIKLDESKALQVVLVTTKSRIRMMWALFQLFWRKQLPKGLELIAVDEIQIKEHSYPHVHIDGDMVEPIPAEYIISVLDKKFKLVV